MAGLPSLLATAVAVAILATIAATALAIMRVPNVWAPVTAIARALVQLALLALVLAGIIDDPIWVAVALIVMMLAAISTAARRAGAGWVGVARLAASMTLGPLVVLAVAFGTGATELSPRYALAIGGIIIGNTMSITILAQRLFRTSLHEQWEQVEGWLAVGATPWESTRHIARRAIQTALIPSIDQTRTTGIVVLPGAFVGAIFAGASPLEAGAFQVVVLAGALAAGALSSVTLLRLTGGVRVRPALPTEHRRAR